MPREATQSSLLHNAQEYLRQLLAEQVPDTVLTAAWDEFYRLYDGLLRRFVAARGLRGHDLDDCLQDVWATVATRLIHFERPPGKPGLRSWLYTVVRSRAIDFMRERRPESLGAHEHVERAVDPRTSPSTARATDERCWREAIIQTALAELGTQISRTNRRIVELRLLDGRSTLEVADELGLEPEQVRYRQHRALARLRNVVAVLTGKPTSLPPR